MIGMNINLEGEGAWKDLIDKNIIHIKTGVMGVAILNGGLTSGRPSVALRIELPDGQTVIVETTARLFVTAGNAIHGRYPNLFED